MRDIPQHFKRTPKQQSAANSRDLEILREMHKVLFASLAITSQHLHAFDVLLRAAGYDPKEVYGNG